MDPAAVLGKTRWEQGYTNKSELDWAAHQAVLDAHVPFRDLEVSRMDRFGKEAWYTVSGEPVFDAAGAFAGYRGVGRDITDSKLDENARRHGRSLSVMFVDLDRFKIINDTLGHHAGDQLLQEIATRLRHTLRASDIVARLGGDEFVVMIPEVEAATQAEAVARKVLAALVKPMFIQGEEYTVTASIGICLYPRDAADEQSLMKNADTAMYRAKDAGKNNYRFYSDDLNANSVARLSMETSLRRALEQEEFFLQYQPRVDIAGGTVTSVEALVRWQRPGSGPVPPGEFIPLAEETGIIVELGDWVLRTACAQAAAWHAAGFAGLRMAVNVSARQFANDAVVNQIMTALDLSGLAPELLELELTETVVARNVQRAAKLLAVIRGLGVRLALDDFGTGYSSLAQLKRFPIDTLKIDRSFVSGLPIDGEDAAITQAIIAMGRSLRMVVVAEGVETVEQQAFLQAHGCHEMQGFLFSRPLGAAECAEFLRGRLRRPRP
jgi:diguanylate cyclase (GGDEF)-like protein